MKFITIVDGTKSIILNFDFIVRVDVGEDIPMIVNITISCPIPPNGHTIQLHGDDASRFMDALRSLVTKSDGE